MDDEEEEEETVEDDTAVVSFSHFIPHLRLYRGHPNLNKVMVRRCKLNSFDPFP